MKVNELILLMEAVKKNEINEFIFKTDDGEKIVIRKNMENTVIATSPIVQSPMVYSSNAKIETEVSNAKEIVEEFHTDQVIVSPLVGTFYSASSPGAEPFVKVGDHIKKGQVVGIIEAMKLMNEIESEFDGVIEEILIGDEEVVEYGQPLFRIR